MYCPKCGEENMGNPTYCKKCGTKLKNKEIAVNEPPKTNDKNKIIIIALVAVIVILIVGMLFVGGVFKSGTPQANASNSKNTTPSSSGMYLHHHLQNLQQHLLRHLLQHLHQLASLEVVFQQEAEMRIKHMLE